MMLTWPDWIWMALFLILSLGLTLGVARRAGRSLQEFFLSGRAMPGWLAGISMAATTFAADTPLAVTELVRRDGISGNWLWWNMLLGGLLTTFFFARYWHRAGVLTDIELIALRYSGRPARLLRGFKAVYFGLVMNTVIMAWVNLALQTVLEVYFDLSPQMACLGVAAAMILTAFYAGMSGLWGVVLNDALQFGLAMLGCIVLASQVLETEAVGGLEGLRRQLESRGSLAFFPTLTGHPEDDLTLNITLGAFVAFAGVQWWASWYPGAEPGGGGYAAQRMMSTRNEGEALGSALLFQLLHYAVRPWPWIIVGLATLLLYPDLPPDEDRHGFVLAMRDHLPAGWRGLMLVAFIAAYMSTISTHLNWGVSYLVNDLYRPFVAPHVSDEVALRTGRLFTAGVLLLGLGLTPLLDSIRTAWEFILQCGAGLGLVLILRWYWWRVSAWSELTATVVPFLCYGVFSVLHFALEPEQEDGFFTFPNTFLLTVGLTTLAWVAATFLFPATDRAILAQFYRRVQPRGFWGPFHAGKGAGWRELGLLGAVWLLSAAALYGCMFAVGKLLLGYIAPAMGFAVLALVCGGAAWGLYRTADDRPPAA